MKWKGLKYVVAVLVVLGAVKVYQTVSAGSMFDKVFQLVGTQPMEEAADFELPSVDGNRIRLSDYRGKSPVLLYFWAIWCPSCRSVKPEVVKLRREIDPTRLEILAINVGSGDSFAKLKRYQQAHPMPFKVLYDGNSAVSQAYQVRGIPLFVVVNKDGKVVYRDHQLPRDIRKYLD